MQSEERNVAFIEWLKNHEREGYVEAFISLQTHRPDVLRGLDNDDWVDIFLKLPPAGVNDPTMDLCDLFSAVKL